MEDDFIEEEGQEDTGREDLLENDEIDGVQEGFLKGYEDEELGSTKEKGAVESADDEEKLKD